MTSVLTQHGFLPPVIDADSEPWWHALKRRRLVIARCADCRHAWLPLTPGCPACGSTKRLLEDASGRGVLYSWVVVNRALHPEFRADAPYTIAVVELEEGPRIFGRLFAGHDALIPGARLAAMFYDVQGTTLLGFLPDRA